MDRLISLLCPLSDFPYMLPRCVPVGWLLALSAPLPIAALLLATWLGPRPRRGKFPGQILVRGVVCGGPAGELRANSRFTLRTADAELLISTHGAAVRGGPLIAGRRVVVNGIDATIARTGEHLFREPARQPGIDAIEVRPLRWPWSIWLALVLGAAWAVFAGTLLVLTRPR